MSIGFVQACLGMSNVFQNNKATTSPGKISSYFVYLLHAVTHLWRQQCYLVILVGYGPAYSNFSETAITNIFGKG